MYRGTTPTVHFTVDGYSLDDMTVYVTFRMLDLYGNTTGKPITKVTTIKDGSDMYVTLTQEETLALCPGQCKVQARFIDKANNSYSTNIVVLDVLDVLDDRVIKYQGGEEG